MKVADPPPNLIAPVASAENQTGRRVLRRGAARAFTLLEVILALVIATGLMVVAIYYYQQIAELRVQTVREMERLSTVRLLLDKITTDLRAVHSLGYFDSGFVGGADYIQFVKAEVPAVAAWNDDVATATVPVESDLKRIGYTLVVSVEETNATGSLMRWEEPNWPVSAADENSGAGEDLAVGSFATLEDSSVDETNSVIEAGTTIFTDQVPYLHFRYFDGAAWVTSWDGLGLPMGVEVSMSPRPWSHGASAVEAAESSLPAAQSDAGLETEEYPDELFRRIVVIPSYRADFEAPEDWRGFEEAVSGSVTNDVGTVVVEEAVAP